MTRFFSLGKTMNFRHMGDYGAADQRVTRGDRLFRSGFLEIVDAAGREVISDKGIQTIYDFRSPVEREKNILSVDKHIEVVELGMLVASVENLWDMLLEEGLNPEGAAKIMAERYRELTVEEVPGYRAMFQHMLNKEEGGALVMCSFGKDRAGIASALLLGSLGVSEQEIQQDYLLSSNAYADKEAAISKFESFFNNQGIPVDRKIVLPILDARTQYLDVAWDVMRNASGSLDNFMTQELGLNNEARRYLQQRFTA
ncbi:MAG: tyrosine-protein phosphatase [Porticoccaceae bacterium]